ncbi:MAG: DNA translocase FtsK 4TM domain-containing protein [Nitrospinae bacterium]|nr:DNA translocase FtsK 4TM domain-containing protein [Nitrospinota bacterium]
MSGNKKTDSGADKATGEKEGILREISAILLIALGVFVSISLYSYNRLDPSFNRFLSSPNMAIANSGGIVGAYLSDILIQFFGIGAYMVPLAIILLSWVVFFSRRISHPALIIGGLSMGLISLCSLMNIYEFPFILDGGIRPGGAVGVVVSKMSVRFLNTGGAVIMLLTILLVSFIVLTGMSIRELLGGGKDFSVSIFDSGLDSASKWLNRLFNPEEDEPKQINKRSPRIDRGIINREEPEGNKKGDNFQEFLASVGDGSGYILPPLSLLDNPEPLNNKELDATLINNSKTLVEKLSTFGVDGRVVQVIPGPMVTMYEFEPGSGIKVSRILNLSDDLSMAMKSANIRIHAPLDGKSVVGIEIPNIKRAKIVLKDIIAPTSESAGNHKLTLALGKDVSGLPVLTNLAEIPHLLIAGATGSGKSVGINSMISSILFKATPDEVKFIMIDPKMLELSVYDGIPHLITPVVTHPKKAANALRWAVEEMERRYQLIASLGMRNIDGYNRVVTDKKAVAQLEKGKDAENEEGNVTQETYKKLPYIVVVIDELADLMMVASKDVEDALIRLAQMARASGIHLLVATQRPSVDVLTGLIKANFPARISYQVTSRVDSRTILDSIGAERLLGKGDMLFMPPGTSRLQRIHGAYISEEEVKRLVEYIKKQERPIYDETILEDRVTDEDDGGDDSLEDEYYDQAVALVAKTRKASISMVQRRLRIGYNRAARLIEIMEKQGVVGPADGVKPRDVYIDNI